MKSIVALLCLVTVTAAAPFAFGRFGGQAQGTAHGGVAEGLNFNPYSGASSHITNTGANAAGTGTFGAPNYNNAYASNVKVPGGASLHNTGANSVQPGGGFGFGGAHLGFGGGYGGQASGASEGKVTQGFSTGPQGYTQIVNTGSDAKGNSLNGAPNFSNAHANSQQTPYGASIANTGATAVQPGFSAGPYGGGFGGYGGF